MAAGSSSTAGARKCRPRHLPILTLLLCTLAECLMLLPQSWQSQLYFERAALASGEFPWGLLAGQWLHADIEHLYWNMLGLAVLGWIIESHSRRLLLLSLAVGMASVNLLLLSPWCELERYCGLSGLLNTLLGVAIYLRWQQHRSPLIASIALACMLKLAVELCSGDSLLTAISWAPYPLAHLAGLLGALAMLAVSRKINTHSRPGTRGSIRQWACGHRQRDLRRRRRRSATAT